HGQEWAAGVLDRNLLAAPGTHGHQAHLDKVAEGHRAIDLLAGVAVAHVQYLAHLLPCPGDRGVWEARSIHRRQVCVAQAGLLRGCHGDYSAVTFPRVEAKTTWRTVAAPLRVYSYSRAR